MFIYKNSETKSNIQCKKCGLIFPQTPHCHLAGRGCPECCLTISKSISNMEIEWLDRLDILPKYRQKSMKIGNRRIVADAFDPGTNTIYEFFGDFYHGNPIKHHPDKINPKLGVAYGDLYSQTLAKIDLIQAAGYNLIHIWEHDWLTSKKQKEVA